jgi:hypothetical protein
LLLNGPSLPEYAGGWVPGLAPIKSHASIKVFGMQLDLSGLFHYLIHVARCSGYFPGVHKVDVVTFFNTVLGR